LLIPLPILFPVDFGEVAVVGEPVGDCVGLVVPAAVNPLVTLVAVIVPDGSATDGNVLDSAVAISSTCCEDTAWVNTTVTTIDPLDTTHHSTELLFNPPAASANSVVILHTMSSSFCERVVKSPSDTVWRLDRDVVGENVGDDVGDVVVGAVVGDKVGVRDGAVVGELLVGDVDGDGVGVVVGDEVVGEPLGEVVGDDVVGEKVGEIVGDDVVGEPVGEFVGDEVVGESLGAVVGDVVVGELVGAVVGDVVVGELVGAPVGEAVGDRVGEVVGDVVVGDSVGDCVGWVQLTTTFPGTKRDGPSFPHPVYVNAVSNDVTEAGMVIVVSPDSSNANTPMVVSCEPASNVTVVRSTH
jgi:hypothetical protein